MVPDLPALWERYCWWVPRRPAFFLSALWAGSQIGAYALAAGFYFSGVKFDREMAVFVLCSPLLLFTGWLCANVFVMGAALGRFSRMESLAARDWGVFAGIEAFFCLLPKLYDVKGPLAVTVTWAVWLLLVSMLGTGTWFFHRWQLNRWAGEIAMLKAENASRRAHGEGQDVLAPEED